MIILKPEKDGFCPFLKFDNANGCKFLCSINDTKPAVCANHPIGTARAQDRKMHFFKVPQCPNSTSEETHVLKDWVHDYIEHEKEIITYARARTYAQPFCRL